MRGFDQGKVKCVRQLGERIRLIYVRTRKKFLGLLPEDILHLRRHFLGLQLQAGNIGQQE